MALSLSENVKNVLNIVSVIQIGGAVFLQHSHHLMTLQFLRERHIRSTNEDGSEDAARDGRTNMANISRVDHIRKSRQPIGAWLEISGVDG